MEAGLQQLQGIWQAVRVETESGPVPAAVVRQLRYVFAGDRVTLFEGDRATGTGIIALHAGTLPAAIDVVMTDGPGRGRKAQGIYEVVGGLLRLCIGPERPTVFHAAGPTSLVELESVPAGPQGD
jgi:uncharacterized protein (TIGR03067 family)